MSYLNPPPSWRSSTGSPPRRPMPMGRTGPEPTTPQVARLVQEVASDIEVVTPTPQVKPWHRSPLSSPSCLPQAFKEKGLVGVEWSVELYGELLTTGGGKERMARYFTDYNPSAWPDPTNPPAKDHPLIMDLHKLKTKLFMDIIESGSLPLRPGIQEVPLSSMNLPTLG